MVTVSETDLQARLLELQARFDEAEATLRALRFGEVDAILTSGSDGDQVCTLRGTDQAYRVMVEGMGEGALTVTAAGLILFSNERFAALVHSPLERVIGAAIVDFVANEDAGVLSAILGGTGGRTAEIHLRTPGATTLPVYLSAQDLLLDGQAHICLIIEDLSEQRSNEKTVAAENLVRSILEQAAEAIIVVNPQGLISRASAAAERLVGSPVVKAGFDEKFPISLTSGSPYPFSKILAAVKKHPVKNLEVAVRATDGRNIESLLGAAALRGARSEPLGCVLNLTDITERKLAEERLLLFQAFVEGARDYGIVMLDPEGCVIGWNEGAAHILGYQSNEVVGHRFSRFFPSDADDPDEDLRTAQAGKRFESEGWQVRRDGSLFWSSAVTTAIFNKKDGRLRGFFKLIRDISERRESDKRLRESEHSLRCLADAMPQIVWTADPDGRVDYYNSEWYELTQLSTELTGDASWAPVLHPDDRQPVTEAWYSAVGSGSRFEMNFRFWDRRSCEHRWYLGRAVPLRDELGAITKWVGTCTDIHDHKRLAEELEKRG